MFKPLRSTWRINILSWIILFSIPGAAGELLSTQPVIFNLDGENLVANHLTAITPAGYRAPKLTFGAIPDITSEDGRGMTLFLTPGTGYLIVSLDQVKATDIVRISGRFRASNAGAVIALGALNSPVDNQLAYINLSGAAIPVDTFRRLDLFYAPPNKTLQVALQAVVSPFSTDSTTVWVDDLRVESFTPAAQEVVTLEVDGSFEYGIDKLITNINGVDGDIKPYFETLKDVAIRLMIQPSQLAANIGTTCTNLTGRFPTVLFGGVQLQRENAVTGGQTAMVLTNGLQNLGLFRSTQELPGPESANPEYLMVGSDFFAENPTMPVMIVVQNGGPGVESSIVVDDLTVTRQNIPATPTPTATMTSTPIPILTPTTTPTIPVEQQKITIFLPNLPADAKPLKMVYIPAGSFRMGSPENELDRDTNESPQHQVTITQPFYMGIYEVTQAQWQTLMGNNPSYFTDRPNNPVEQVSWNDCMKFIEKLNTLGYGKFRLPTEAEWEYSCRAGTTTRFFWGEDSSYTLINYFAWYNNNAEGQTHEVGLKNPNPWGLYDISGNVYECCQDWYGSYSAADQIDPVGSATDTLRVNRGASWFSNPWGARSAYRYKCNPNVGYYWLGFRVVLEVNLPIYTPTPSPPMTPTPTFQTGNKLIIVDIPGLSKEAKPFEMSLIPSGTFVMGSPVDEIGRKYDESPQHEVTLSKPFYIGRYEITQAQWLAVMGFNPSNFKENINYPVDSISWYDCQIFISKLNQLNLGTFRLPTEAEWEYACRAGTTTAYYWGNDEYHDYIIHYAWYKNNSEDRPHEVGIKIPNAWGLYDMSGNVWEWTNDWRGSYPITPQIDPQGPLTGDYKIHRGGCWASDLFLCRSAFRSDLGDAGYKNYLLGVRLVREYVPAPSPTPTLTMTPTFTPTATMTPTMTPTPTFTATKTPTFTPTIQSGKKIITVDLPGLPMEAKPLDMIYISAGTFFMGSPEDEIDRKVEESPLHEVTLTKPFYIGRYEITQAQWQAVMGFNPANFKENINYPVESVSWYDCQNFIKKLNQLNLGTFRLPTEAEWEYACRAGTTTRFYWGDDENYDYITFYAWFYKNSNDRSHEVGGKAPNAWGLYDMSGNVWEWTNDWKGNYPSTPQLDPQGPLTGEYKIDRGGCWASDVWLCRSAFRTVLVAPGYKNNFIGVRLVREYP